MSPPERPLRLGELLAETVRIYGERPLAALGLGAVEAGAFLVADALPPILGVLLLALSFTAAYGAAARIVSGDSFGEAWAQVGLRAPVLLVLTFVVAVPFAIAVGYLFLLVLAVLWIALAGFAVPVAMLERDPATTGFLDRLAYALYRSTRLARVEYLHAAGVAAALVILYLLLGNVIGAALVGFADNGGLAAGALVQLVLAPLFFLGLSVLYYEQRARAAVSSAREAR
ncbi:MAG TPA: hypothetical protein VFR63_08940 [Gaiellaceae bacterium]|nr:hypothetical protein [Gaiellaceae bacterium]